MTPARRAWLDRTREARSEYYKRYRLAHLDEIKAHRRAKRPEIREVERLYWESHREQKRANDRAYYQRHRERIIAANAAYGRRPEEMERRRNARLRIGGKQSVSISTLPPELQEVARLIKQTRKEIRKGNSNV